MSSGTLSILLVAGLALTGCGDDDGSTGNQNGNANQNGNVNQGDCGNGTCDPDETTATCPADCVPETCGNGTLEAFEACDGTDLAGETCVSQGFTSGTLRCAANCQLDRGQCNAAGCGDGVRQDPEACDRTDLGGATCGDLGRDGGTPTCTGTCALSDVTCCDHACPAADEARCTGEVLEACQPLASGCLVWTAVQDCAGSGQTCEEDGTAATCVGPCVDACPTEGETRCTADVQETCTLGAGGCTVWMARDCTTLGAICTGTPAGCRLDGGDCANPLPLALADLGDGTLQGERAATTDLLGAASHVGPASCDGIPAEGEGSDVVHRVVVGTGYDVSIALTPGFDALLRLLAAPCDPASEVPATDDPTHRDGCSDHPGTAGESLLHANLPAGTYYVVVDGIGATDRGAYTLRVTATPTRCGNGDLDAGEACDDGGQAPEDGCSGSCQVEAGWICAGAPSTCEWACGNGAVDAGEACDDGDLVSGDGCSDLCRVETGYACAGSPSTCLPTCGNGALNAGETCDDGDASPGDGCSGSCQVEPGWACAGSPSVCRLTCGDGVLDPGEQCDDLNRSAADGCSDACQLERITLEVEPNDTWGQATARPHLQGTTAVLGSWGTAGDPDLYAVEVPEGACVRVQTFDANGPPSCVDLDTVVTLFDPDGVEVAWSDDQNFSPCADIDPAAHPEACHLPAGVYRVLVEDYDNDDPGSYLLVVTVTTPTCGDGVLRWGQTCDDGDAAGGDGCSAVCLIEPGWACAGAPSTCTRLCGNGAIDVGETCDDLGVASGDGCSATCQIEAGWLCSGTPSTCEWACGNGDLDAGETCDDLGTTDGDGCSATCQIEAGFVCGGAPSVCTNAPVTRDVTRTPGIAIPDGDIYGVTDVAMLPGPCTVISFTVPVDITHPYIGDLTVRLESPQGTILILHNRTGDANDDLVGSYPTTLTPVDDLAIVAGEDGAGTWTLTVVDGSPSDAGTLNGWGLHVVCAI
jgi:cysteine-rich repeat protein